MKQVRDAPEEPEFSTLLSRGLERQLARSLQLAAAGSAAMTRPYEITELCSQRPPDSQLCLFPATPDVLIPSQSVTSEV
ncbi:hypothetical protein Chor_007284 [Crotalus horridus]